LGLSKTIPHRRLRRRLPLSQPALIVEVDGPTHDDEEQKTFDAARTAKLEALGYLVIRVKEHVVRDGSDHVLAWISTVGALVSGTKFVPDALRRMDTVPLP
jgi:very-short-patch-repair endonuclease